MCNTNQNKNVTGKIIRNEIIFKSFKICGITNEMTGDEEYLFDGYDVINKLTLLQEKRKYQNEKESLYRYQRRNDSDSSSEGGGSNGEDIENKIDDIHFV